MISLFTNYKSVTNHDAMVQVAVKTEKRETFLIKKKDLKVCRFDAILQDF